MAGPSGSGKVDDSDGRQDPRAPATTRTKRTTAKTSAATVERTAKVVDTASTARGERSGLPDASRAPKECGPRRSPRPRGGLRLRLLDEGQARHGRSCSLRASKVRSSVGTTTCRAPPLRDLLNRFSTLLAIKPAGASQPSEVSTKGSVPFFLRGVVWPKQDANEGINSVYLFDAQGRPREIPLLAIWQGRSSE